MVLKLNVKMYGRNAKSCLYEKRFNFVVLEDFMFKP